MEDRVRHLFGQNIEAKIAVADTLAASISRAAEKLVNCLLNDRKILLCGNGGSAANCLHFSAAMINHFEVERPPLPVITLSTDLSTLTSVINDGHYDQVFARQIQAIGNPEDILLVLTTSGNSNDVLQAVRAAHEREMDAVILSGRDGGVLANHIGPEDLEIRVPGDSTALIREIHLFILHSLCDLIEQSLFGQMMGAQ